MGLAGKTVLISGASSGIGAACAAAFAEAGADVVMCARRLDRIDELADGLRHQCAVDVRTAAVDVRSRREVESWIRELDEQGCEIDVLVNNAGLARGFEPVVDGQVEDWEEMVDTNVKGLLYLTRAVLRGMVDRGCGHVINIGSIAGHEVLSLIHI